MRILDDDGEVDSKYGFMIKDLPLKTYCTPEAILPHAQADSDMLEKHACAEQINHDYFK